MEEKELFNYGDKELNVNSLLKYIDSNQQSYLDFYSNSISDANAFIEKVNYIKEGIKNGNITTDGTGVYTDASGKILENDELMSNALHYVDIIAKELSKKQRALTKTEIEKQEKDKELKKAELERKKSEESEQSEKPTFEPTGDWSVAKAFAHSFNNNGYIPYEVLQQLITVGEDGKEIYTDLHTQLSKNFDRISKQLQAFNNTESYITNINAFKKALIDGNLSPQDRLLGMELGFQNSELDKLSNLISYKINQQEPEPVITETIEPVEEPQATTLNNPELQQRPLERDDFYQTRIKVYHNNLQKNKDFANQVMSFINWDLFDSPRSIKSDSEEEFKDFLVKYINNNLLVSGDTNFVYPQPIPYYVDFHAPKLKKEFTKEHLQYIDPKLYNILGLKFFSKYTTTNMYKHFKDLVENQNNQQVQANKEGGIIKAQGGVKLDFNKLEYTDIDELTDFTSYDAKQMAEVLNSIPTEQHTFTGEPADALDLKRKSIADFITRLKVPGGVATGNGTLTYNITTNKWEPLGWEDKSVLSNLSDTEDNEETTVSETNTENKGKKTTTSGTTKAPKVEQLTLKQLNFRKQSDFNSNGTINSLAGYLVNEIANSEKQKIQKTIPIYQEVPTPEKSFKTAYTYNLEKSKNEILADANSIKPITSDVSQYYAARNEAIKNAREYTTKLDDAINDVVIKTKDENATIAFDNASERTKNANTNAKYRHDWEIEQKQGEVDRIEASNQSFQNLNKEIKHDLVTAYRQKKKQRDAYAQKHLLKGIMTAPYNYIDGWNDYYDLIWYKGQNNQLQNDEERALFQQLYSIVQQVIQSNMASYEGIEYEGMDELHVPEGLMADFTPKVPKGAKGIKISKQKMYNFINKLK